MATRIGGVDLVVQCEDVIEVYVGKWLLILAAILISEWRGNVLGLPLAAQLSFLSIVSRVYYGIDICIYLL